MDKDAIKNKLEKSRFFRHDVTTVLLAIPTGEAEINREKLSELLLKKRFPPHEVTHVCNAVFN